jgi:hypothetical protein
VAVERRLPARLARRHVHQNQVGRQNGLMVRGEGYPFAVVRKKAARSGRGDAGRPQPLAGSARCAARAWHRLPNMDMPCTSAGTATAA